MKNNAFPNCPEKYIGEADIYYYLHKPGNGSEYIRVYLPPIGCRFTVFGEFLGFTGDIGKSIEMLRSLDKDLQFQLAEATLGTPAGSGKYILSLLDFLPEQLYIIARMSTQALKSDYARLPFFKDVALQFYCLRQGKNLSTIAKMLPGGENYTPHTIKKDDAIDVLYPHMYHQYNTTSVNAANNICSADKAYSFRIGQPIDFMIKGFIISLYGYPYTGSDTTGALLLYPLTHVVQALTNMVLRQNIDYTTYNVAYSPNQKILDNEIAMLIADAANNPQTSLLHEYFDAISSYCHNYLCHEELQKKASIKMFYWNTISLLTTYFEHTRDTNCFAALKKVLNSCKATDSMSVALAIEIQGAYALLSTHNSLGGIDIDIEKVNKRAKATDE